MEREFVFHTIHSPEEQENYGSLLTRSFGFPQGTNFYDDFPVWKLDQQSPICRLGAFSQKELAAAASVRVASYKAGNNRLKVGIVGGVVTDERWRSKGLATDLVREVCRWSETNGTDFLVLWGSEHSLYRKLGFELCGLQLRVNLKDLELPRTSFIQAEEGWKEDLFPCLQKQKGGLEYSSNDLRWVSAHQNTRWLSVRDGHRVLAYLAYGRGVDLRGMIHEWGGEPAAFKLLLAEAERRFPGSIEILGNEDLFSEVGISSTSAVREYLCMAKVIRPKEVVHAFYPKEEVLFERVGQNWMVTRESAKFGNISETQLVKLLFGPERAQESELSVFPLPLWFWGLDSA